MNCISYNLKIKFQIKDNSSEIKDNNKRSIINERNLLYNEIRDMETGSYDTDSTIINK